MSTVAGMRRRAAGPRSWPRIDRASSADLMQLASEVAGAPMQVGVVLVLQAGPGAGLGRAREVIAHRVEAVPRLRQRLVRAPWGCGRPFWADDPGFDIRQHIRSVCCPAPGDESALLGVAAELVTQRLSPGRPLWSATLVTGLAGGDTALVIVFHHVLADGIGGLAVLAQLVDGAPTPPRSPFPEPAPPRGRLFVDACRTRLRLVRDLPAGARQLSAAVAELAPHRPHRAPRCSLNQPTGRRRALAVARAELAAVHAVGQAHDATVNDVILTAVAGALHTVLRHREETIDTIVVSVPVSTRREASATQLGNQGGVLPLAVPATGDPLDRLGAIGRLTRDRKTATPGASAALLGPAFRVLAKVGVLRWFVNRQRLVNTFVTNLHGPDLRLSFLGSQVTAVIPVTQIAGNVTTAFAVLSYAGDLVVTIVADPDHCHDLSEVTTALQNELDALTSQAS